MPTKPTGRTLPLLALLNAFVCLPGCSPLDLGVLAAAGPIAADERQLLLWVVALSLVVVIPVVVLTPWLVWRYRYGQQQASYRPHWEFSLSMEILTWGVPVIVVMILGVWVWNRTHQLDPYLPMNSDIAPFEVQVVAMDWKWLFIYPQVHVATLNQLVVPSGRPVHLSLTSATVMQSLLIPQLSGQIYAMAGMQTQLYFQADQSGQFTGRNTQFNGEGFQTQQFETNALPAHAFDEWLAQAQHSDLRLDCRQYQQLNQRHIETETRLYRDVQPGLFDWVVRSFSSPSSIACGGADPGGMHD